MSGAVDAALTRLMREESSRIVASLARSTGSLDLAEDALQDALAAATTAWTRDGVPADPVPWVYVVARRRAIDRIRRRPATADAAALDVLEAQAAAPPPVTGLPDERLELFFGCCHPALRREDQVALTLRVFGGLTTAEIAAAFLVPEATMGQRLSRARARLAGARAAFALPSAEELPARLDAVLVVLYLLFNEGYAAGRQDAVVRVDLCDEAIRLARLLAVLLPHEPEVAALCALMLFHDARRATREDADGAPVPLEDQDRSRWDATRIAEADALLERALAMHRPGPFVVEACIAALHAQAPGADQTDHAQIAALYGVLARHRGGEAVDLARIAALAMAEGPDAGLALLDALGSDGAQARALRAELLRRAGRVEEAQAAYRAVLADGGLGPRERRFADARLRALGAQPDDDEPHRAP